MILIIGTVDIFYQFMQCPLHPEWSAPCSVIWINAIFYGFFLLITIIFAVFSARKLRKVKKKIEIEFLEATNNANNNLKVEIENIEKTGEKSGEIKEDPKKIIVETNRKDPKKPAKERFKKESDKVKKVSKENSSTSKKATKK